MIYHFIALLSGICLYAYYAEIVTITIAWSKQQIEAIPSVSPQPLTIVYPCGTRLTSETKFLSQKITPQTVIAEWYYELAIQGLLESPTPPLVIIHLEGKYCTLVWKKNPIGATRSLTEHSLIYRSLQETLHTAGYQYQGIYWCDEKGPIEDQKIAYEQGIRTEFETTLYAPNRKSNYFSVILYPYGIPDDQMRIDGEYPLTIARNISEKIKKKLDNWGISTSIIEAQESLNYSKQSVVLAISAISKSPSHYTVCWYESASDMVRYRSKNLRVWVPAYEAAALCNQESSDIGKKLFEGLSRHRNTSFLGGGLPIAPLYGIIVPAIAIECRIENKHNVFDVSEEISTEIMRILQIEDQKN